jgi:hypothetical protein
VTLTACNGGTANLCASSNTASVVTYGPIGTVSINATPDSPARGDQTTNWSINVDPNGAPVHWVVRSSVNGIVAQGDSGNGAFSRSGGETLPYNTSVTYTVNVTDISGHGRAGKSDSNGARTGDRNLSVTVSKGRDCSERPCTGAVVPCGGTCWYIVIHTSGFSGGVGCTYHSPDGSRITSSTWTQGGNETRESWWWNGDPNAFYIKCDGPGSESERSPTSW